MRQYRQLLVGLDLDDATDRGVARDALTRDPEAARVQPGSSRAAEQALWLARRTGAEVTFYHSTWRDDRAEAPGPDVRAALPPAVERFVDALDTEGVTLRTACDHERPWVGLTRRVLRGENDLVLVPRRSHGRRHPTALGSTTRNLARNCPAPVWVVHHDREPVHRTVLAATDLTEVGARATQLAAWVADAMACDLRIGHAWQLTLEMQQERSDLSADAWREWIAAHEARLRDRILSDLGETQAPSRVHVHVGCTSPVLGIRQLVEEFDPGLVVMGTVARTGIPGFVVGNTAERLLDELTCALLLCKPPGFESPVPLQDP